MVVSLHSRARGPARSGPLYGPATGRGGAAVGSDGDAPEGVLDPPATEHPVPVEDHR
jgi:hypothetical protein